MTRNKIGRENFLFNDEYEYIMKAAEIDVGPGVTKKYR